MPTVLSQRNSGIHDLTQSSYLESLPLKKLPDTVHLNFGLTDSRPYSKVESCIIRFGAHRSWRPMEHGPVPIECRRCMSSFDAHQSWHPMEHGPVPISAVCIMSSLMIDNCGRWSPIDCHDLPRSKMSFSRSVFWILLTILVVCLSGSGVHAFGAGNIPSYVS